MEGTKDIKKDRVDKLRVNLAGNISSACAGEAHVLSVPLPISNTSLPQQGSTRDVVGTRLRVHQERGRSTRRS